MMFFLSCISVGLLLAFLIIYIGRRVDDKRNAKWLKERDAERKIEIEKYLQEYGIDHPVFPPMRHCREGFGGGLIDLPQTPDAILIAEVKSELAARLEINSGVVNPDRIERYDRAEAALVTNGWTDEPLHIAEAAPTGQAFKDKMLGKPYESPVAALRKRHPDSLTKEERRTLKADARRRADDEDLSVPFVRGQEMSAPIGPHHMTGHMIDPPSFGGGHSDGGGASGSWSSDSSSSSSDASSGSCGGGGGGD